MVRLAALAPLAAAVLIFAAARPAPAAEPLKLAQAISLAEQQGHGKTVEARALPARAHAFQVTVLSHDGRHLTRYRIDALDGRVVEASSAAARAPWTDIDRAVLENAPTSIGTAITAAEARARGRARAISVSDPDGQLRYTVEVARREGGTTQLVVDGSSGRLASAAP